LAQREKLDIYLFLFGGDIHRLVVISRAKFTACNASTENKF